MSEAKHTPGPWYSDGRTIRSDNGENRYTRICEMGVHGCPLTMVDFANRDLITAAPETAKQRDQLLAALKGILTYLSQIRYGEPGDNEIGEAMALASINIARAEKNE